MDELGIDIERVPFVVDDALDATTWIEIVTTIVNPTDSRIQLDPRFEVVFTDGAGGQLAVQQFVDDSDQIFRELRSADFIVGPRLARWPTGLFVAACL